MDFGIPIHFSVALRCRPQAPPDLRTWESRDALAQLGGGALGLVLAGVPGCPKRKPGADRKIDDLEGTILDG